MYLLVNKSGKYWRYNFRFSNKSQTLALGVYPMVSIKEARAAHRIAWKKVKDGVNPCFEKRLKKNNKKPALKVMKSLEFEEGLFIRAISEDRFKHAYSLLNVHKQTIKMFHQYLDEHSLELVFEGALASSFVQALRVLGVTEKSDFAACEEHWRSLIEGGTPFYHIDYIDWVLNRLDKIKMPERIEH